ncbi:MAG TPA: DUF3048 domain-containing protein [Pseudoneobacillus sp.]|nr:DUF3048 domain-containing protein [Pseudoneobacillus sp.]
MKLTKWIMICSALILLLVGCKEKEQSSKPIKNEPKVEEPKQEEPAKEPAEKVYPFTYPLTGMGSDVPVDTRAVAVMINNHPKARPQSGLPKADMVFELLAEGDITRFLAVFQSEKPDRIGPVRSARDYYIELAKGLKSIYIAHGYSPEAKQMLESGFIDNLNGMKYDGSLFKRASFRKAPHNSYITYENIVKGAEKNKYSMKGAPTPYQFYTKAELDNLQGKPAKSIMVSYFSSHLFNVMFDYDEAIGKYKRFSNGQLTIDYDSKERVLLDNILILEMEHTFIDTYGRRSINLTSGGKGYLVQKGKWNEITWKNVDGQIVPFQNGVEAKLVPGKTWINVIPTDPGLQSTVSISDK